MYKTLGARIVEHGRCQYTSQPIRVVEPQWHKNIELKAQSGACIVSTIVARPGNYTRACNMQCENMRKCEQSKCPIAQLGFPRAKTAVRFECRRREISVGHDGNPTKAIIGETKQTQKHKYAGQHVIPGSFGNKKRATEHSRRSPSRRLGN